MTKAKLTRAEQLARHRKIFLLARERDVSLGEAEQLLAREEWLAAQERLKATRACGRTFAARQIEGGAPRRFRFQIKGDEPWMMRD
ncbi:MULTISPECIES: hypothetical protein [unclassified Sphingopyxis]|uniref:hypothetical protein n=1 Tax=unclassified Sphingopyxis TaxID=2614943 RepID=UPI0007314E19|nr:MULTISPECIES: hypothetical protein [unclassified Sphingopyxis]KTE24429.1 hypothetical protein ATE61_13565 [Sphingopyxis sp. H057]KTE50957.1 hypothetical protein ATE69_17265 [Sphingopyxis sp. H071]KTE52100.1 hypothetical protein ATE64_11870 [Sphingopyxis sp. H073]KTE60567.1 hypothetical protein ATE66_08275 [Sphingopyxis sp. H107]KTE63844.1 hypothetical protein ATE65_13660 [Sphingopyxis sp. H100]